MSWDEWMGCGGGNCGQLWRQSKYNIMRCDHEWTLPLLNLCTGEYCYSCFPSIQQHVREFLSEAEFWNNNNNNNNISFTKLTLKIFS
jgi:hypothetical protein